MSQAEFSAIVGGKGDQTPMDDRRLARYERIYRQLDDLITGKSPMIKVRHGVAKGSSEVGKTEPKPLPSFEFGRAIE